MNNGNIFDLKRGWNRFAQKLILPEPKKYTFSVCLGLCTHRDVKVKVWSLIEAMQRLPDPLVKRYTRTGDALIARARANMATSFYHETDHDYLMFFDDDVFTEDITGIHRMMFDAYDNNLDIMGAAYMTKTDKQPRLMFRPLKEGKFMFGDNGKIDEVKYINTGCMMIHRRVIEKMIQSKIMPFCIQGGMRYYPWFNPAPYNLITNEWWDKDKSDASIPGWNDLSEDWAFIQRALDLGFKCWLDTRIKLSHVGEYVYTWDDINRFSEPKKILKNLEVKIVPEESILPAQTLPVAEAVKG